MAFSTETPRPLEVRELQKRFTFWRNTRRGGEKIPRRLWFAAVRLCRRHSVHRVSRWLRLNDSALRERIQARRKSLAPRRATFVEYTLAGSAGGTEYELERQGVKIRVRGAAVADVAALAKLLGSEQP